MSDGRLGALPRAQGTASQEVDEFYGSQGQGDVKGPVALVL